MTVYSVEGKLGTGKTKFAVWRAVSALRAGRRVAGNVDLNLEAACPNDVRASYIRIPDKPSAFDLEALGVGNDTYDEERNGVLLLDELATWLNSRSFQDKSRAALLDWLVHARKFGWDVYLIVQDSAMIDRQVREALIEYRVRCMRFDKARIPLVGSILNDLFGGRVGYLPRMHMAAARVGDGVNAVVVERWMYRGDDLHSVYDTKQVFSADYPHGAHSVLHPGRFTVGPRSRRTQRHVRQRVALRPKRPEVLEVMQLPADQRIRALRARLSGF